MIVTITIILSILVGVNFLLLIFSCNNSTKRKTTREKVQVLKPITATIQQTSNHLAPTGS